MTFFEPGASAEDVSQRCPVCGKGQPASPRYPRYLCAGCVAQATDAGGRPLVFCNAGLGGGFAAIYSDTDEHYDSQDCYVQGVHCWADEARFGGIVVQPR